MANYISDYKYLKKIRRYILHFVAKYYHYLCIFYFFNLIQTRFINIKYTAIIAIIHNHLP